MIIIIITGLTVVLAFGLVLLVGAPYLPTLKKSRVQALDLLDLKPGQVIYELGCGGGSLLIEAANRGLKVVGYELNPLLYLISYFRTRHYRSMVKIYFSNFWRADLSPADGVYVFLLDRFMAKLDKKISTKARGKTIRLVSHGFEVPGRKFLKKRGAMFLYVYR